MATLWPFSINMQRNGDQSEENFDLDGSLHFEFHQLVSPMVLFQLEFNGNI